MARPSLEATRAEWERLGRAYAHRREAKGLSQQDAADRAQVSLDVVSVLENGRRPRMLLSTLRALGPAVGWPTDWAQRLLAGEEPGDLPDEPVTVTGRGHAEWGGLNARGGPAEARGSTGSLAQAAVDNGTRALSAVGALADRMALLEAQVAGHAAQLAGLAGVPDKLDRVLALLEPAEPPVRLAAATTDKRRAPATNEAAELQAIAEDVRSKQENRRQG